MDRRELIGTLLAFAVLYVVGYGLLSIALGSPESARLEAAKAEEARR